MGAPLYYGLPCADKYVKESCRRPELTDDEILDAIRGLGEMARKVLTRTIWKDGIDIEVPTVDARNFARWITQSHEKERGTP
jgi:hypothetical protein